MTAPPGTLDRPTLSGERITAGHDLETRNGQRRFLCAELRIDQREARRLIAAYEADIADAVRIGNDTARSDFDFLDWLIRQAPGPKRNRSVIKHGWKETSS
ncbi:hypothetical protein [Nocardioides alcanivorans]|uniref:hypothetical protein n=1 Tax=Nocardioides alcanivorans TaxID=2897352 RepID=UPI001F3EF4F4|nr:hypothetical protein [Nocardioides alcanivorans]